MPSFAFTKAHYLKSFHAFRAKSGENMKMLQSFQTHIPPLIQSRMDAECQQLKVLSVGSAEGKIDRMILKIIKEELGKSDHGRHMKIFNRAIEPNEHSCALYKAAIENLDDQHTDFEICQKTFQEYQESKKVPMSFDIVHFIHSIYYVDIAETLFRCFEKEVSSNGYFVCVVNTSRDLPNLVMSKQKKRCNGKKATKSFETAEKLIQIANNNGWKHEVYTIEYPIDVTEVFDPQSTEGNLLLDFLTHTVNFRKTADKLLVEETLALIESVSVVKNGKSIGEGMEALLVIQKPNNDM